MTFTKHLIALPTRSVFNVFAQIVSATTQRRIAGAETMLQARETLAIVKDAVKCKKQQLAAMPAAGSVRGDEASAVNEQQQLAEQVVEKHIRVHM